MASETFAKAVERFLVNVEFTGELPTGIEVMRPYSDPEVCRVVREMAQKYYSSPSVRLGVWGINPGRFGAGITGLSFTDPWAVENLMGIPTSLSGRRELSAEFITAVIEAYGGAEQFYSDVYLGAMSPLGFVRGGVNVNFYDDRMLERNIVPFVKTSLRIQIDAGLYPDRCVVLGTGALRRFVEQHIRSDMGLQQVVYLEHPRYIMQYKRSAMSQYVSQYCDAIRGLINS